MRQMREPELGIAESEQLYRSLFDYNPELVYSLSRDGLIQRVNLAWEKIVGCSMDELVGTPFAAQVHPGHMKTMRWGFSRALKGETQSYEIVILAPSGRQIDLDVTDHPIMVSGEVRGVLGIARDITARKKAEAALMEDKERQTQKLEEATRRTADIAHGFNNILGVIAGNAQLMQYELMKEGCVTAESIDEILRASDRAAELTRQLMALSSDPNLQQ